MEKARNPGWPMLPSPRELAQRLSCSRRDFLRTAAGLALGGTLLGTSPFARAATTRKKRKVIVITFGGGARDQETFAPQGQENIPHLMRELIPQSTFFTQVVNRGILGHYVATASLATGVYETINNFAAIPPEHPDGVRIFPQRLEAAAFRCLGRGPQQWIQSDRRERCSLFRSEDPGRE